jgi:Domain of unknown function (DUF4349)
MRIATLTLALCSLASLSTAACGSASYARTSSAYSPSRAAMASSGASSMDSESVAAMDAPSSAPAAYAPRAQTPSRPTSSAAPARAAHGAQSAASAVRPSASEGSGASVQQAPANVLLIYNAQLVAQVDHVPAGIDQVIEAATSIGGFLASRTDSSVTVRVPVARFREALGRVEALSTVTSRNVQTEDVTEAFHDLEVRLTNLRSVQTRLQQFLARASSVTDALAVERELERVGQAIDEIEGRMRFLTNRAAFSTITVTLTARPQPNTVSAAPSAIPYAPIPDTALPFEVLEQLGLPRLLTTR